MTACIFCRIVAGREPAQRIEEWPETLAIVPLNPVTAGHWLVLPKVHAPDYTWDPIVTATTMARAAELADLHRVNPSNLITSAGVEATQSVFHLHVHIVPRKANDGLALPWYSGKSKKTAAVSSVPATGTGDAQ